MKQQITTTWLSGLSFENDIDGFKIIVDAPNDSRVQVSGPSPKKLLLAGLAGCTGMDIDSILQKMREPLSSLSITIEAVMTDEHPKIYSDILIAYQFQLSDNLDKTKVLKAVNLSQETYCGVAAMLKKGSNIKFEIEYK